MAKKQRTFAFSVMALVMFALMASTMPISHALGAEPGTVRSWNEKELECKVRVETYDLSVKPRDRKGFENVTLPQVVPLVDAKAEAVFELPKVNGQLKLFLTFTNSNAEGVPYETKRLTVQATVFIDGVVRMFAATVHDARHDEPIGLLSTLQMLSPEFAGFMHGQGSIMDQLRKYPVADGVLLNEVNVSCWAKPY